VRSVGVVFVPERVDGGLGVSDRHERRVLVEQLPLQGLVESFDFARGRG
jgi:hypothetical protein